MNNQEWIVKLFSQASLFGEDANDQDGLDELDEGLAQDSRKRANDLDGKTWLRYSVSIWSDIRKSPEEIALGHPAIFPVALAGRLIEALTNSEQRVIFDPFVGVGSTLVSQHLTVVISTTVRQASELPRKVFPAVWAVPNAGEAL